MVEIDGSSLDKNSQWRNAPHFLPESCIVADGFRNYAGQATETSVHCAGAAVMVVLPAFGIHTEGGSATGGHVGLAEGEELIKPL